MVYKRGDIVEQYDYTDGELQGISHIVLIKPSETPEYWWVKLVNVENIGNTLIEETPGEEYIEWYLPDKKKEKLEDRTRYWGVISKKELMVNVL